MNVILYMRIPCGILVYIHILSLYDHCVATRNYFFLNEIILGLGEGWVMVFNATFNNISAISWRSVLLAEETGVLAENHRPAGSH